MERIIKVVVQGNGVSRPQRHAGKKWHGGDTIDVYRSPAPLVGVTFGAHQRKSMNAWRGIAPAGSDMDGAGKPTKPIRGRINTGGAGSGQRPGWVEAFLLKSFQSPASTSGKVLKSVANQEGGIVCLFH